MLNNKVKVFKYLIVGILLSLGIRHIIQITKRNISLIYYIKSFSTEYGFCLTAVLGLLFLISCVFLGLACEVFLLGTSRKE